MTNNPPQKLHTISRKLLQAMLIPSVIGLLAIIVYVKSVTGVPFSDMLFPYAFIVPALITFALLFIKKFTSRIRTVGDAMTDLSDGHSDHSLTVEGNDEIAQMAVAINKVSQGFREKTEFITQIEAGNLNASYTPFGDLDLLGHSLVRMKGALIRLKTEEEKRTWAAEGLARFSGVLQSASDIKSLSDQLIIQLVKFLQATQGAIFVLNDGNDIHLEMTGCYAYGRLKYMTRRIEIGEGLVGQTFLEKQTVYLRDIPDNYTTITSGLGEARIFF